MHRIAADGSLIASLIRSVVTCSSVGFGDLVLSVASRPAALLVLLPSIGIFMLQAARLARLVMDVEVERSVAEFVARGVTVDLLRELDRDRSGAVERHEFLAEMLVHTGKVERAEVLQIEALFRALDRDGKGKLDEGDLRAAATPGTNPKLGNSSGSVVASSTAVVGWAGMETDSDELPNMGPPKAGMETDPAERDSCLIWDSSSEGDSSASGLLPDDVIGVRIGSRTPWQRSIQRVNSSCRRVSAWLLGAAVGALPSSALKAYFELRLSFSQLTTVKLADAGVAAGLLAATVWVLHSLDEWGGLRPLTFFSTPMLASAVLFFAGPTPPPPMTFVISTLGAFVMGLTMHHASNASFSGIGSVGTRALVDTRALVGTRALESVGMHASAHHGAPSHPLPTGPWALSASPPACSSSSSRYVDCE